ncbi:hypothetical protein ACVW1A_004980 [Bradyrhizobium sp. LB1.3]
MSHALFVLVFMMVASPLAAFIPLPALAGLLVVVCWNMAEKEEFVRLLHEWRGASVLIAAFGLTLIEDLTTGIIARCVLVAGLAVFDRARARSTQPSGSGRAGPVAFVTIGKLEEPLRIAQDDPLPASFDQPLALPCAQDPADCVQRGPRHLGHVLPADREVDLDAGLDLAAGLFREPQQGVRDPLFDLFVRYLDHAGLGILQAAADGLQRAAREARIFDDQACQDEEGQASAMLSTAATAVAG